MATVGYIGAQSAQQLRDDIRVPEAVATPYGACVNVTGYAPKEARSLSFCVPGHSGYDGDVRIGGSARFAGTVRAGGPRACRPYEAGLIESDARRSSSVLPDSQSAICGRKGALPASDLRSGAGANGVLRNASDASPKMRGPSASKAPAKRRDAGNIALNVVLVAAIVALVVSLFSGTASGAPRPILGWSASTVLTGSMQDVYPQGSLILTRYTDPWDLQVGDDVTFLETADTSITHRIIEIAPSLEGASEIAFKTQGTMNPYPDDGYVLGSGIVGKVVFCSPELGAAVNWLKTYWAIPVFLIALAFGLKAVLAHIYKDESEPEKGGQKASARSDAPGRPPRKTRMGGQAGPGAKRIGQSKGGAGAAAASP